MLFELIYVALLALKVAELLVICRVILRPHRDPASRIAWVVIIAVLPVFGILFYLFFGETNIGRRRAERRRAVKASLPPAETIACAPEAHENPAIPAYWRPLFHLGETVNGLKPVGGNTATLLADSNSAIDALVTDIDAAKHHVHILFYIWLPDNNGGKVADALKRAVARGVSCRALVDAHGSRILRRSAVWKEMREAGVRAETALKLRHPLLRALKGRIDLRNHRKIVVIDNYISYTGSQNCADPEFLPKAKYAPWVDILMRFEGPIAIQNQYIFVQDWMSGVDEDIREAMREPGCTYTDGFPALVIATGPTLRNSAMPETFVSLLHAARHEIVISTPYYVPNDAMQTALCSAARRGVATSIIFPANNDSAQVGAASRSYYPELLEAGVKIYEYRGGLLHAKSITLDGEVSMIGSANMDRRSFDLNYENNVLLYDKNTTSTIAERQRYYLQSCKQILASEVEAWPIGRRLKQNVAAMLGPLL